LCRNGSGPEPGARAGRRSHPGPDRLRCGVDPTAAL